MVREMVSQCKVKNKEFNFESRKSDILKKSQRKLKLKHFGSLLIPTKQFRFRIFCVKPKAGIVSRGPA